MKPPNKFDDTPHQACLLTWLLTGLLMFWLVPVCFFGSIGCSETTSETVGAVPVEPPPVAPGPIAVVPLVAETPASLPLQETGTNDQEEDGGVLKKAGDLLEKAKSKSGSTASEASKWVQNKLGDASDAGEKTADDSWKWATETYESLKAKGMTTADSTSEWLGQDWNNMESWEYKIITLSGSDEELSQRLNKLGKEGWNCFQVDGERFFFKKPILSYLRHMPFKDFIKLVPLMTSGDK